MLRFVARRAAESVVTILVILSVVFVVLNLSGDPIRMMASPTASEQEVAALRTAFGFDKPLAFRYFDFLSQISRLRFGDSISTRQPALKMVLQRMPATLLLAFTALGLATIIGIPLGMLAAVKRGKAADTTAVLLSMVGQSMPVFWIALLLIFVFGVMIPILPPSGYGTPAHLVLPSVSIAIFLLAGIVRITRASMLEVLEQPFVTVVRSKGVDESLVLFKHVFRNASIPVLTQLTLQMRFVIGGSVVVESVFGWPGVGQLLAQAAYGRDYPVVIAATFFIALFILAFSMVLDLAYGLVDPRVRIWH
ncbi:MAG: ABC transporter permease [Rectinemataceae bacterium]|nr:ABC transporter permease [Rectinemataceae bacterium]